MDSSVKTKIIYNSKSPKKTKNLRQFVNQINYFEIKLRNNKKIKLYNKDLTKNGINYKKGDIDLPEKSTPETFLKALTIMLKTGVKICDLNELPRADVPKALAAIDFINDGKTGEAKIVDFVPLKKNLTKKETEQKTIYLNNLKSNSGAPVTFRTGKSSKLTFLKKPTKKLPKRRKKNLVLEEDVTSKMVI